MWQFCLLFVTVFNYFSVFSLWSQLYEFVTNKDMQLRVRTILYRTPNLISWLYDMKRLSIFWSQDLKLVFTFLKAREIHYDFEITTLFFGIKWWSYWRRSKLEFRPNLFTLIIVKNMVEDNLKRTPISKRSLPFYSTMNLSKSMKNQIGLISLREKWTEAYWHTDTKIFPSV